MQEEWYRRNLPRIKLFAEGYHAMQNAMSQRLGDLIREQLAAGERAPEKEG